MTTFNLTSRIYLRNPKPIYVTIHWNTNLLQKRGPNNIRYKFIPLSRYRTTTINHQKSYVHSVKARAEQMIIISGTYRVSILGGGGNESGDWDVRRVRVTGSRAPRPVGAVAANPPLCLLPPMVRGLTWVRLKWRLLAAVWDTLTLLSFCKVSSILIMISLCPNISLEIRCLFGKNVNTLYGQ